MAHDEVSADVIERWWRELAAEANHFHVKTTAFDAAGNDNSLPHARLFALLAEAGYEGDAAIEFQGEGDAVAAVRRSREMVEGLWGAGGK